MQYKRYETRASFLEGIESKAELDYVKSLGIAYAQGFYIGHPQLKPLPLRKVLI